jgi:hypothetical protein
MEVAMQCPVCAGNAENLTPNTLDGVVVGCGQCGDYRISGGAFYGLMRLEQPRRAAVLAAAKRVSPVGWPMIGAASLSGT